LSRSTSLANAHRKSAIEQAQDIALHSSQLEDIGDDPRAHFPIDRRCECDRVRRQVDGTAREYPPFAALVSLIRQRVPAGNAYNDANVVPAFG
jgi:hypothetical protein